MAKYFKFKNKEYRADYSLSELLNQRELLTLSLKEWKELLQIKDGHYSYQTLKVILLALIDYYDKSQEVNAFYYKDTPQWLDKNTRIGLQNLINCGATSVTVQLSPDLVDIDAAQLHSFLNNLEVYAGACFSTTARHKQAIKNLNSEEDLLNYDFKTGYPLKLVLA